MSSFQRVLAAVFAGLCLIFAAAHVPVLSAARLQSGAVLTGSVVDSALKPVTGVVVTLERGGVVQSKVTTAADGRFRFASLAAGSYRVRADLAGFVAFTRDVRVAAGATTLQLPIVLLRTGEKLEQQMAEAKSQPAAIQPPPAYGAPPPPPATAGATAAGGGGGRGGGQRSSTLSGLSQGAINITGDSVWPRYRAEGETYPDFEPNRFQSTTEHPLSTFGADVDTASYTNVRRFLSSGQLPPREAVRIEEMVNYFKFAYPDPRDGRPIALTTEVGDCPWAPSHKLVLIGAKARASADREIAGRNIVLLIDVSGSMAPPERLPLIKSALGMFVDTLRPDDTLSIVTYAGTSGIALYPTPARNRDQIQRAIAYLNAGGSTNGGEGLVLAYRIATQAFVPGGVNRVILATDGDFNVGVTSQGDLLQLIKRERESGVFLSVFGVGSGNLKDRTMEMLADRGNGNYSYLDSLQEARRVLVREADATLETVAKDVKFQVEFNPAAIAAWKLIGYEDRALRAQDFNNDLKDAGEMGAGHTVTVLYEVIPVGASDARGDAPYDRPSVDPLRYQAQPQAPVPARPAVVADPMKTGEWLQVKARYKQPAGDTSELITGVVRPGGRVQQLPFASAVAEFGLLLRDAPRNVERWDALVRRLNALEAPAGTNASDRDGFRELVEMARGLSRLR